MQDRDNFASGQEDTHRAAKSFTDVAVTLHDVWNRLKLFFFDGKPEAKS